MKILLAADGSDYSDTAAGFMERTGLWDNAEVTVLHVMKEYIATDIIDAARDFKTVGEKAANRLIDDMIARHAPQGSGAVKLIREGEPWHEIVGAAADTGADLIVMGHRGVTGLKRFMVGSMVHSVARHSEVSVLVVRELPLFERPMKVLFCTDGSYASVAAREFLANMPITVETDLHVLAVVDMDVTSLPEQFYPEEDLSLMMKHLREQYNRMASQSIDEDASFLKERFGHVTSHLEFGVPDEEILKKANDIDADLIVMGCRGVKGIRGMLVGSASHRVIRHSYCGVLVVKTPDGEC